MKWVITSHAVEQLRARVNRTTTGLKAHGTLVSAMAHAKLLPAKTPGGQEQWVVTVYDTLVVVIAKDDHRLHAKVALTVVRKDEPFTDLGEEDAEREVLAAYQRARLTDPERDRPSHADPANRLTCLEGELTRERLRSARLAQELDVAKKDMLHERERLTATVKELREENQRLRHVGTREVAA